MKEKYGDLRRDVAVTGVGQVDEEGAVLGQLHGTTMKTLMSFGGKNNFVFFRTKLLRFPQFSRCLCIKHVPNKTMNLAKIVTALTNKPTIYEYNT